MIRRVSKVTQEKFDIDADDLLPALRDLLKLPRDARLTLGPMIDTKQGLVIRVTHHIVLGPE